MPRRQFPSASFIRLPHQQKYFYRCCCCVITCHHFVYFSLNGIATGDICCDSKWCARILDSVASEK